MCITCPKIIEHKSLDIQWWRVHTCTRDTRTQAGAPCHCDSAHQRCYWLLTINKNIVCRTMEAQNVMHQIGLRGCYVSWPTDS